MGSVIALVLIVVTAYVVVMIGAVAYELTGMDRDNARFQALSAFTNCGFTTQDAEEVVRHPVRRQITMTLIILGYAGLASVAATLMRSINVSSFQESALHAIWITLGLLTVFLVLRRKGTTRQLTDYIRRKLTPRMTQKQVPQEDLLTYGEGFGVTRIEIPDASRVAGRRLRELDLRERKIQVMAVEIGDEVWPVPDPDVVIRAGDRLILYGQLDAIETAFRPEVRPKSLLNRGGAA